MRMPFLAALSAALLAGLAPAVAAQTRFFIAGGPTGTSDYGFRGGWGGALGLERRIAPAGSFLVRLEGSTVPTTPDGYPDPYRYPSGGASLGDSSPGSKDATLVSVMVGLRLKSQGPVLTYLDALVGVGYFNDPFNTADYDPFPFSGRGASQSHTNVAFGLGPGIAVRAGSHVTLFADVRYDRYFVEGADTPLIPVRMGLIFP